MEASMYEDSVNGEDHSSDTIIDATKTIADDVTFNNQPLQKKEVQTKKRKNRAIEAKKQADEEYNRELHEQRYKRLMHLLKRSKFYSSYICDKVGNPLKKDEGRSKRKTRQRSEAMDENTPPQTSDKRKPRSKRQNYDIREYISADVQMKLTNNKNKLNLSQEDIEDELSMDSEHEMKQDPDTVVQVSKYFNGELRDYQKVGLQWLKVLYENGINGILGDEMGLGKTIQVIALMCHLIEKQQSGPYLICAPLSTIPNWMLEFERFAPKIPIVVFHGPKKDREPLRNLILKKTYITHTYKTQPVVITSYEIPLQEYAFMRSQNWRYIVVDEGQRIKNHECQLIGILKSMKSMNRLLLTGTPLQNNLAELWSLLNFLLPEIFDDLAIFQSWFDVSDLQYGEGTRKILKQEEEKHVLSSLREILKPFMLRREKLDVCVDIPPKKELIVYVPVTKLQHDLYRAVLDRDIERLSKISESPIIMTEDGRRPKRRCLQRNKYASNNNGNTFESEMSPSSSTRGDDESNSSKSDLDTWIPYTDVEDRKRDFFTSLQLRNTTVMYKKIVNHPYLVHYPLDSVGMPKIDNDLIKASGKLLVLDAMLAKLKSQGHKVLLFSTMTMILDMIEDYLMLRDHVYVRLDGLTQLEDRKNNIKNFNENPDIFLFLISTRAGGVGLNLAAADTVIIYDSDWNPQADIQAMARCHRIGQTRAVVVYRLCAKGTIDEAIINRAEAKRVLEKMVISKEVRSVSLNSKEMLLQLQSLIESKDCEIFAPEKEVFTEAELDKLLDRCEMIHQSKAMPQDTLTEVK